MELVDGFGIFDVRIIIPLTKINITRHTCLGMVSFSRWGHFVCDHQTRNLSAKSGSLK